MLRERREKAERELKERREREEKEKLEKVDREKREAEEKSKRDIILCVLFSSGFYSTFSLYPFFVLPSTTNIGQKKFQI